MNPDDLIKAAPAIAKGAEALAAAIPFTAIVKRMLGPAADEVAEMWRDQVRVYRYGRQLKLLEKAERMAQEAGCTPQAVPPKILFPLLEGASFEDDEELHTMWAALLANAASPENAGKVEVSFIAILKQISPEEAQLLNWFRDTGEPEFDMLVTSIVHEYMKFIGVSSDKANAIAVQRCFDALESYQLLRRVYFQIASTDPLPSRPTLTDRGRAFLEACEPPKPKA
ncbi:MAG: Abi-alpha family protein [Bryobacteraceae bacterium]|jgi:hypothetical protein